MYEKFGAHFEDFSALLSAFNEEKVIVSAFSWFCENYRDIWLPPLHILVLTSAPRAGSPSPSPARPGPAPCQRCPGSGSPSCQYLVLTLAAAGEDEEPVCH